MVQSRTTGSTISCLWQRYADHARLPVMMPRKSDSDMCRGGSNAASMQPENPADEHGRLHGVSDLQCFAVLRRAANDRDHFTMLERKQRWRILGKRLAQLRWQDKRRAVGWGAGRWNYWEKCASQLAARLASSIKNGAILALSAPSLTFRPNSRQLRAPTSVMRVVFRAYRKRSFLPDRD
jgi:hypothetical protein